MRRFYQRPLVALVATTALAVACGSDEEPVAEERCAAAEPVHIADLFPGLDDHLLAFPAGDRIYVNALGNGIFGSETWVTGPCGEAPLRVAKGQELVRPLMLTGIPPEDRDPTTACALDGPTYRVDLDTDPEGPPTLTPLLAQSPAGCHFDPAHPVLLLDDGAGHRELWRYPNFPSAEGSVRLATGIGHLVGANTQTGHSYFIGDDDALHAVAIASGDDTILLTSVLRAEGGATGEDRQGPTRILALGGETQGVYLYRGEHGDTLRLADPVASDSPPAHTGWAWSFDDARLAILHRPYDDTAIRAFDRDGEPVPFPAGVRREYPHTPASGGTLGSEEGPDGRRWVVARPGETVATPLAIPWEPAPALQAIGAEEIVYTAGGQVYHAPLDGGPALEVPAISMRISDQAMLAIADGQLLHVDRHTGDSTVLREGVGAFAPTADGIFFTSSDDPAAAERTGLWFMPAALIPGFDGARFR